jgi:hypothetical protein
MSNIKNIWLNTPNGNTDSLRRVFTFFDMPLVQVKRPSVLKINSVTLSGAGHQDAKNHNWVVKLHNVNYNQSCYYNSDKNAIPTIVCFNFDEKNSIQNGLYALEIEPQDIQHWEIEVFREDGIGLLKGSNPIDLHMNIILEEIETY